MTKELNKENWINYIIFHVDSSKHLCQIYKDDDLSIEDTVAFILFQLFTVILCSKNITANFDCVVDLFLLSSVSRNDAAIPQQNI